jgi:hypothetical protein
MSAEQYPPWMNIFLFFYAPVPTVIEHVANFILPRGSGLAYNGIILWINLVESSICHRVELNV